MVRSAVLRTAVTLLAITILLLLMLFVLYTLSSPTHARQALQVTGTPRAFMPVVLKVPTPTSSAIIRITEIYLPPLLPKSYEYVRIANQGGGPQVMTDWKLKNETRGDVFNFPVFTLEAGRWVKVYSRAGRNDDDELYWWDTDPWEIWHPGDIACIYEPDWTQVHCYP